MSSCLSNANQPQFPERDVAKPFLTNSATTQLYFLHQLITHTEQQDIMDDGQEDDIAAQMGFSSFGSKPKKRKLDTEVTSRPAIAAPIVEQPAAVKQSEASRDATATSSEPYLRAFRNGVRNERGDMAYFMPSFIEDPWEHLRRDQKS